MDEGDKLGGETIFPVVENNRLVVHAGSECPYAKCSYCPLFGVDTGTKFKFREFERYLGEEAGHFAPEEITSVFISAGNAISMDIRIVEAILKSLYRTFSHLQNVALYGSAYSILRKRARELKQLKSAGLSKIHVGIESASDKVLSLLNKGVTSDDLAAAATKVNEAGIGLCLNVLIGAGGKKLSSEHCEASVEFVNGVKPMSLDFHTLVPVPGTPLYQAVGRGAFELLTPHGCFRELSAILEGITAPLAVNCLHVSNFCQFQGLLPDDRDRLLRELECCLTVDETLYGRPVRMEPSH